MKYLTTVLVLLTFCSCSIAGCEKEVEPVLTLNEVNHVNDTSISKMRITIGSASFTATLHTNASALALKAMLPLSINMEELNGNEKFHYFSTALPTNAARGGNIQAGDLMLYGNNCLVLFYESLNSSYSYTRIGRIDNIAGLAAALGTGTVGVKFELL